MTDLDLDAWVCPTPLRDTTDIVTGLRWWRRDVRGADRAAAPAGLRRRGPRRVPRLRSSVGPSRRAGVLDRLLRGEADVLPRGSIGDLAVNGTVSDLAMPDAAPPYPSAAFILTEGTVLAGSERLMRCIGPRGVPAAAERPHLPRPACVVDHPRMVVARIGLGGTRGSICRSASSCLGSAEVSAQGTRQFALYAYPPNELGYCGPLGAWEMLDPAAVDGRGTLPVHAPVGASVAAGAACLRLPPLRCTVLVVER